MEQMMIEEHFALMETLDNIRTIKLLHDHGFNIEGLEPKSEYFNHPHQHGINFEFNTEVFKRIFEYADYFEERSVRDVFEFLGEDISFGQYHAEMIIGLRDPLFETLTDIDVSDLERLASPSVAEIKCGPKKNMLMLYMDMGDLEFSYFIENLLNKFNLRGVNHESND